MNERGPPHKDAGGEGWRCAAAVVLCSGGRVPNNNELSRLACLFQREFLLGPCLSPRLRQLAEFAIDGSGEKKINEGIQKRERRGIPSTGECTRETRMAH